jgi:hypothetical protein
VGHELKLRMKFLRAVRLDASDQNVYDRLAVPGEWAVPGSFALWDVDFDNLNGKGRQAFGHGFLGTASFGWTTLVTTAEIDSDQLEQVTDRLADHLIRHYGAPNYAAAREIAEQEVEFTTGLCEHPVDTLIAVDRELGPDGIVESFRVVEPADPLDHSSIRLWGVDDER